MEARARRSVLSAFLLGVLLPGSGLLYVHKPLRALLCALCFFGTAAAAAALDLLADFHGLLACLGLAGAVWLYALLASMLLARKGLTPENAQHDIGPWIAAFLLLVYVTVWLADTSGYTGYAVSEQAMSPVLEPGDYALGRRTDRNYTPAVGDLVVFTDRRGDGRTYIRRVAAVSGDVVEMRNGLLFRNGGEEKGVALAGLPGGVSSLVVPEHSVLLAAQDAAAAWNGSMAPVDALSARLLYIYWSAQRERLGALIR